MMTFELINGNFDFRQIEAGIAPEGGGGKWHQFKPDSTKPTPASGHPSKGLIITHKLTPTVERSEGDHFSGDVRLMIQPVGLADIRQSCHAAPKHFTAGGCIACPS